MTARSLALFFACILPLAPRPAHAEDLCKGKTPGSITFFSEEISRDKPLPAPATTLTVGKPMFALACLTDTVGPQKEGGTKFRTSSSKTIKPAASRCRPARYASDAVR